FEIFQIAVDHFGEFVRVFVAQNQRSGREAVFYGVFRGFSTAFGCLWASRAALGSGLRCVWSVHGGSSIFSVPPASSGIGRPGYYFCEKKGELLPDCV